MQQQCMNYDIYFSFPIQHNDLKFKGSLATLRLHFISPMLINRSHFTTP